MGIFDGVDLSDANKIKDKQVFIRFGSGTTKCEVLQTSAMRTFHGKTPLYLIDFKVLETDDPELSVGDVVNFSQNPTTAWGLKTVRNFLVAAAGLIPGNPDDQPLIDGEDWEAAIRKTSNNPSSLKGETVVVTTQKATSRAEKTYTKASFATTPETRQRRLARKKGKAA